MDTNEANYQTLEQSSPYCTCYIIDKTRWDRLNDRLLYCYRHLYIYAETPGVGRLTQLRFGKESLLNLQRQVVTVLGSIPARCNCWVSQTIYRFNSGGCQLFFTAVNTGGFRHHPRPRNYIMVLTAEVRPRHYIMVLMAEHQVREWFLVKAKLSQRSWMLR